MLSDFLLGNERVFEIGRNLRVNLLRLLSSDALFGGVLEHFVDFDLGSRGLVICVPHQPTVVLLHVLLARGVVYFGALHFDRARPETGVQRGVFLRNDLQFQTSFVELLVGVFELRREERFGEEVLAVPNPLRQKLFRKLEFFILFETTHQVGVENGFDMEFLLVALLEVEAVDLSQGSRDQVEEHGNAHYEEGEKALRLYFLLGDFGLDFFEREVLNAQKVIDGNLLNPICFDFEGQSEIRELLELLHCLGVFLLLEVEEPLEEESQLREFLQIKGAELDQN